MRGPLQFQITNLYYHVYTVCPSPKSCDRMGEVRMSAPTAVSRIRFLSDH